MSAPLGDQLELSLRTSLGTGTLPAQIHEYLEEAIIEGDIAPGTRLRADDIAAHYGVSRIPVREALRSLHEAGWVEIRPRYGVYVRDRSSGELRELFEARAAIEGEIAAFAAQRRTASDIERMTQIVAQGHAAAASGDRLQLSRLGVEFNAAVRKAADNAVFEALSATLEKRARFYFATVAPQLGSDWVKHQEQLTELIVAGDADAARRVWRGHIEETGAAVAELITGEEVRQ